MYFSYPHSNVLIIECDLFIVVRAWVTRLIFHPAMFIQASVHRVHDKDMMVCWTG